MRLLMQGRFKLHRMNICEAYMLPYERISGVMKSQKHVAIRIPQATLYILLTPLFIIIVVTPLVIIGTIVRLMSERYTGSPPVMAPGHRWKDHREAGGHALARIAPRQQAQTAHTHGLDIPRELVDLILDHLDPASDYHTLLNCGLVCPCWLAASRLRAFDTIYLVEKRAYAGWRLLRSPHCTFIPCIQSVILQDAEGWNISDTLLRQLIRSNATPSGLALHLFTSIIIPPRHTSFCNRLTNLRIVKGSSAFGRNLSRFAAFIAAFPVLQVLHIDSWLDFNCGGIEWGTKPLSPAPHKSQHVISPHLRQLTIQHVALVAHSRLHYRSSFGCGDINLPYLILQHYPKLESLTLVAPGYGYGPYMSALSDYFVAQGKFLRHLAISPPLTGVPWQRQETADGVGLNRMIPIYSREGNIAGPRCHFPVLRTLRLTYNYTWTAPEQATVDTWLLAFARGAPLLENITVEPLALHPTTANALEKELGFRCSDLESGTGEMYTRAPVERSAEP